MARTYNLITIVLLLLTSLMLNISARPVNVPHKTDIGAIRDAMIGIFSLTAIKIGGGPSPGGKGHEFSTADSFGNIKNSGPSAGGKGYDITNADVLGYVKNSGPSPGGKGHEFPDAKSLGSIKNSGPSAEGKPTRVPLW